MKKRNLLLTLILAICLPWVANGQETMTVYDQGGSTTSSYVPFWGNWADNNLQCEMVYPATKLEDLAGGTITSLHFYTNGTDNISTTSGTGNWDGTFQIFMKEVSETTITAFNGTTGATIVYEGQIPLVSGEMTIELTTPYVYGGDNLLVGFYYTTGGHYKSEYFLGETVSGASIYGRSGQSYSVNNGNFLPKTTFTYTPDANFCAKPTNLHIVGEIGPRSVTMAWDAEAGDVFQYSMTTGSNPSWSSDRELSTLSFDALTPDTDWNFFLRKHCGSDSYSQPVSISFHTNVACPAPSNLALVANTLTATNAQISWTGYSDSYTVQTGTPGSTLETVTVLSEGFEGGSMPDGWSRTSSYWKITSGTGNSSYTGAATGSYNAGCYISSYSGSDILVTPAMDLSTSASATLNFNFWNTAWGSDINVLNVYYRVDGGNWNLLYTNDQSNSGWTAVPTITLEGLAANYQIGFECESNYSYGMGIDDVEIVAQSYTLQWTDLDTNASNPFNFNNTLSPETTYKVRVIGVCSGNPTNPSDIFTFTTLPSCLEPSDLAVTEGSVTAHEATITWTENGDATSWDICVNDDETNLIHVNGTPSYHFTGLTGETTYSVKVLSNCSNGDSNWSSPLSFTTLVACAAPVDFTAVVNGTSVTLSWTGAQSDIAWSLNASANPDDYIDPDFDIDQAHGTATMSDMALDTDYYFWVRTNCGGIDGTSAWVGPVSVHIGYCVPSFGSNDDCITNITLGDINNTTASSSTNGYGLYTNLSTTLEAGEPATLSLTSGAGSGYHGAAVWIDFNDDMVFDDSERVGAYGNSIGASTTVNIDLTIPSDAATGSHRMRVVYQYATDGASISPCASATYGEAEDYTVVIVATSCPTPSALNVTDLGPTSATLNWTSDAEDFYVRYRTAAHAGSASFFEDFENGIPATWTTIDSDEDDNNWLALSEISSVYTSYSGTLSDWAHNGSNAAASPSYANGVGCFDSDQWLITPQVNLGGMLKFYAASTYDDLDAFEVLLSTTGTAISDFTTTLQAMHHAPYALNDGTDDWEEVTIDLSSYSGQGYIAIHHVSDCMYFLVIDDFGIYTSEEAGQWLPNATGANTSDNSLDITGLTPETEYEWQVMADCGEDGASNWSVMGTFTTPSRCITPNGLNAEITGNTAQLTWIGGSDTYNLQYREVDPTEPATIILTAGDVWEDGSGYQMLLDADATAYDDGVISDYSIFEYLIPTDAEYDYNTSAVVINNSVSIQIPAGTYDWFITNPSPGDAVYVAALNGNVGGSQDNYVFEAGKTYEFVPFLVSGSEGDGVNVTITATWTPVSDPVTSPYTFTGLTPNTTYEFQVQGIDCDGEGTDTDWSESAYFTTPEFYTKHIIGYNDPEGNSGYYLIASPIGEVNPEHVTNMLAPNYDLFYFDQEGDDNHNEWFNYKVTPFNLVAGKGYLYANSNTVDLIFTGTAYSGNGKVALAYNEDCEGSGHFVGWNLVGNPFAQTATIDRDCYVMNTDGDEIITIEGNREVAAMEGIFAIADGENDTITFSTTPINSGAKVVMNVMDNQGLADRAIVRFGEGSQLPKFQLFGNSTKVYFPKDDQDYAVVRSTNENELPVNFKASSNGTYTMSVNIEEIDMDYLHLIDNQTGMDVDLLQRSSYTFEATTSDSESRFLLVFATVDGLNENHFGFVNAGGNLCIYGLDGRATVQVIDMLGHVLSSEQFSGSYEKHLNVAPGVYMIRLIQGNDIKVQKMVVR